MGMVRDLTDRELLAGTSSDPLAFGELYRRHERPILSSS